MEWISSQWYKTIAWGMTTIQQHRKVYEALQGMVGGDAPVHALTMKTWVTPPEGLAPSPDSDFPNP